MTFPKSLLIAMLIVVLAAPPLDVLGQAAGEGNDPGGEPGAGVGGSEGGSTGGGTSGGPSGPGPGFGGAQTEGPPGQTGIGAEGVPGGTGVGEPDADAEQNAPGVNAQGQTIGGVPGVGTPPSETGILGGILNGIIGAILGLDLNDDGIVTEDEAVVGTFVGVVAPTGIALAGRVMSAMCGGCPGDVSEFADNPGGLAPGRGGRQQGRQGEHASGANQGNVSANTPFGDRNLFGRTRQLQEDRSVQFEQIARQSEQFQTFQRESEENRSSSAGNIEISFTARPIIVEPEGRTVLEWSAHGVNACRALGPRGWEGRKAVSGEEVISDIQNSTSFSLRCGAGGNASVTRSVFVSVQSGGGEEGGSNSGSDPLTAQNISVFLSASRMSVPFGEGVELRWNSSGAQSCIAGDDWPRPQVLIRGDVFKPIVGTELIHFVERDMQITLTCFDGRGNAARDTVVITVEDRDTNR